MQQSQCYNFGQQILNLTSSVMPLNKSIHPSFVPVLCSSFRPNPKTLYSVTLGPHSMMLSREHLFWKTKDMTVEAKASVYSLLYERLPKVIMFLLGRTFPLILPLQEPQLHTSHTTNLYDATYHSTLLMMKFIQ